MTASYQGLPYNDELTDQEPQHLVGFGHGYVKYLIGLLELLESPDNWALGVDFEAVNQQINDLIVRIMEGGVEVTDQQFAGPVTLSWQYLSQTLAATTYALNSACLFGGYCYQTTPSDEQNVYQFRAWLVPGNYTLRIWYYSSSNSGIVAITGIGKVGYLLGTKDLYQSPDVQNNYYELDFEWEETGECLFVFTTAGKNAASSNYYLVIQAIELVRDV